MATPAQVAANQANAARSTGPRTERGKMRSRENAYKHGLAGDGVVVPGPELAEVEARYEEFSADLAPATGVGRVLVRQMAALSLRAERCIAQAEAANREKVRRAVDDFDEARAEAADRLFAGLAENPRVNLRRLMRSPEGVELLVDSWEGLKADLTRDGGPTWTDAHLATACQLVGRKAENAHILRIGKLSRALTGGDSRTLDPEFRDLSPEDRKARALLGIVEEIDAEVAALEEHYETLDFESLALDRAEAPERAQFDPSRGASLARRYESEARRGFFKAWDKLREVEPKPAPKAPATPPSKAPAPPPAPKATTELGSFREAPVTAVGAPRPAPATAPNPPAWPLLDRDGQPRRPEPPAVTVG